MVKKIYKCSICFQIGLVYRCRFCHSGFCKTCILKSNPEWVIPEEEISEDETVEDENREINRIEENISQL